MDVPADGTGTPGIRILAAASAAALGGGVIGTEGR